MMKNLFKNTNIEERLTQAAELVPGMLVFSLGYTEAIVVSNPYYVRHHLEESTVEISPLFDVRDPQPRTVLLQTVKIVNDIRNIGHLLEQVRGKFSCPTAWVRMWPAAGIDMSGQDRTRYEVCDGHGRRLVPGERLPAYSAMKALLHALEYRDE